MTIVRYIVGITLVALSMLSCSNEKSLQQYLVDKQEDDKFLKVDLATSLLQSDAANFTAEQQEILNTIKKVNVVAYPIKNNDTVDYESEKDELATIINQEQYKTLMKMGSNSRGATLKYTGDEDAIDELIIFASDSDRGFAVFRVLGDDMRPDQMIKLMRSVDQGDLNLSSLSGVGEIFKEF